MKEFSTCATNFRKGRTSTGPIHYRVIKDEYELILIVEGGYFGTINDRSGEGTDWGGDTILEWYDVPASLKDIQAIRTSLDGDLHELPCLMNYPSDTVLEIVEERLRGFYPENDLFYLVLQHINMKGGTYYEDNDIRFDDPQNLEILYEKITGYDIKDGVEDEGLLKEFF